jgi:hypothetical protein
LFSLEPVVLPSFLTLLLVRIGLGERLEKAKSEDYRAWFGFLFLLPCWVGLSVYTGYFFLDHAGGVALWTFLVASALLFLVMQAIWILFVPASVSLTLGVIAWFAILRMAWHGKLWF